MTDSGRIVVGVDGSRGSEAALRWALDEGRRRGSPVEATHVWTYPAMSFVPGMVPKPTFAHDDLEADARATLERSVEAVAGPEAGGVHRVVIEGQAAGRLMERAQGADLLVVGRRGHGGFVGLLLGSVADQVAAHAPCPVVIVRDGGEQGSPG